MNPYNVIPGQRLRGPSGDRYEVVSVGSSAVLLSMLDHPFCPGMQQYFRLSMLERFELIEDAEVRARC